MTASERFLSVTDDGAFDDVDEPFVLRSGGRRECVCDECQHPQTYLTRCELCLVHHAPDVHEGCPFCTCPDCGTKVDPWMQARSDQPAYDRHVCGEQTSLDVFADGGSDLGHAQPERLRGPPVPRSERGGLA